MKPMLARPCRNPSDIELFMASDEWVLAQKIDGHRRLVEVSDGRITTYNRRGDRTDLPRAVADELVTLGGPITLDGELVGSTFWVFDLPSAGDHVQPGHSLSWRLEVLERLFAVWSAVEPVHVRHLPVARTGTEKAELAERLMAERCEGLMAKQLHSTYLPGKRADTWVKLKFTADVDCVVVDKGRDGKDNLALAMIIDDDLATDNDWWILATVATTTVHSTREDALAVARGDYWLGRGREVGEVTALAGDGPRCEIGQVVVTQCLYASENGRLVQPTRPRIRTEKAVAECSYDQLAEIVVNREVLV